MRNEYIGTSIDGDARAACNCRSGNGNAGCCPRQPRTCGCEQPARQPRDCDCDHARQTRDCDCNHARPAQDCGSNHYPARSNDCDPCEKDHGCQDHSRGNTCSCEQDYDHPRQNRSGCSCNGRTPAMVYAQHHDLDSIYGCERALIRGTLFGCLDKPMCHERCKENPCITQCQADKFTVWELRLYLNTHPCDKQALALLRKLTAQMDDDCGCAFDSDCNRWSWTDGPWPWEYQRCCGKEA